jgi:hypothetical protein
MLTCICKQCYLCRMLLLRRRIHIIDGWHLHSESIMRRTFYEYSYKDNKYLRGCRQWNRLSKYVFVIILRILHETNYYIFHYIKIEI